MRLPARFAVALLLTFLPACGNNASPPSPPPTSSAPPSDAAPPDGNTTGRTQIALIPPSHPAENWKAIHAGALKAISEFKKGPDGKPIIDLLWQPPETPDQPAAQLHAAQTLLKTGIAALILTPDSAETLAAITTAAGRIPIIALESPLTNATLKSTLNDDDEKIGPLAAHHIGALFHGKVRILILPSPQNPAAAAREKSFRDTVAAFVMKDPADTFDIIAADQSADAFLFLAKSPVESIFAPDESTTLAALEALQAAHLTDKIKLVGVGNSEKLTAALKSNQLSALILTDPFTTGYLAVKTAADCIREKKVDKRITIPLHLATPENLATPEIAPLLNPPLAQYLHE